ncbi:hypothetical protein N1030_09805 [Desulfovibrio mangrovi]|uniref:hypothetical protein n=1 Tax=Desulfovibrio mangrovi TaxID=2976983 RepID=UPI002245C95A|nr:hypothetical protein [Desulfovibrio mangrovi]UZP65919.1 hypothetical protein N1030_09805 [Desulfovibrio mangrovi]
MFDSGTLVAIGVAVLAVVAARYPLRSLPPAVTCPLCTRPMGPVRHLQGGLFIIVLTTYLFVLSVLDLPELDYATADAWRHVFSRPDILTCIVLFFIGSREVVTPHHDFACKKCRATWRMKDGELLGTQNSFTTFYHFFPF